MIKVNKEQATRESKEQMKVLVKITHKQAMEIYDKLKDSDDLFLITEWGAVGIPEKAKYVMEWEENGDNWFGDIGFLETSDDGVFVRIKKDNYKNKLPNMRDVFSFKTYYPNGITVTEHPENK